MLSGFTRRLLLQLLLEPEKVYVYVTQPSGAATPTWTSVPAALAVPEPRHPVYRHGPKHQLLYVSGESTCADLIQLLTEGASAAPAAPALAVPRSTASRRVGVVGGGGGGKLLRLLTEGAPSQRQAVTISISYHIQLASQIKLNTVCFVHDFSLTT